MARRGLLEMDEYYIIEPCNTANGVEVKLKGGKISLPLAEKALMRIGDIAGAMPVAIIAKIDGWLVSVYASGRIMVKGGKRPGKKAAETMARKLMVALEKEGAIIR